MGKVSSTTYLLLQGHVNYTTIPKFVPKISKEKLNLTFDF